MNELSKNLMCIALRNGTEIWIEEEYIINLKKVLLISSQSKFIEIGKEVINTADITGIFDAKTMETTTRRKSGQWQDKEGQWHNKYDKICPGCKSVIPDGMKCGKCYGY